MESHSSKIIWIYRNIGIILPSAFHFICTTFSMMPFHLVNFSIMSNINLAIQSQPHLPTKMLDFNVFRNQNYLIISSMSRHT